MYNVKMTEYEETGIAEIRIYDSLVGHDSPMSSKNRERRKKEEDDKLELLTRLFGEIVVTDFYPDEKLRKSIASSVARTRRNILEYGFMVDWKYHCVLTFDKEKVNDRTDYDALSKKVRVWLNNLRKDYPDLVYLVVPELHQRTEKNGRKAWHFHMLLNCDIGFEYRTIDRHERKVYTIPKYKLGYSYATPIDDTRLAVLYVSKYISSDVCAITKNRNRYFVSHGLKKKSIEKKYDVDKEHQEEFADMLQEKYGYDLIGSFEANKGYIPTRYRILSKTLPPVKVESVSVPLQAQ